MTGFRLRALALAMVVAAALAGCGSGATTRATAPVARPSTPSVEARSSAGSEPGATATSSTVAPMTSSPASAARYVAPKRCLLTVAQVESVLGGSWSRRDDGKGSCLYTSDRTAIVAVSPVPEAPARLPAALADVRTDVCDTPPRDVPGTGGGFVCIARHSDGDLIEGNILSGGRFWLFVVAGAGPDRSYRAQVNAVAALLGVVPR